LKANAFSSKKKKKNLTINFDTMGCWQTKSMPPPTRLQEEEEKVSSSANDSMHKRYENRQVRMSSVAEPRASSLHGRTKSGNVRTATKSNALPWKANVLTVFGPGVVTNIARRKDGVAEVTLTQWKLAKYGDHQNTVKIYSPAFAIKKHHRNLSLPI
jgi:hypothetical protein